MTITTRHLAFASVIGLATGVLTQVGQGVLPDGWGPLANSITPWLGVAFLVGSRAPTRTAAIAGGALTLLGALVGYYALVGLRFGYWPSLRGAVLVWVIGAAIGGPVFGLIGRWWRDADPLHRAIGPALLGAASIAEGANLSRIETVATAAPAFIAAGLVLPILLGRSREDRLRGLVALLPCLALGAAGFVATLGLYDLLTRV